MKRCPECRRDYYDDTLLYCLDDGNARLEGPATAILSEPGAVATGFPANAPRMGKLRNNSQISVKKAKVAIAIRNC